MKRVLIVEDERLASAMMAQYIADASDRYELAACLRVADDAPLLCMRNPVDLVLMDICTASNSSGLEAAKAIKRDFPRIKIIIITSAPEYRFMEKAREAGAESFWYKDASEEELLEVMDRTMAGESVYPAASPVVDMGNASSSEFTAKEKEVLYWLVKVGSVKAIAAQLNISEDGVKWHIRNLKEKTGLHSKAELAIMASSTRLVLPNY